METDIKNAVQITDKEAQYDEKAKHLLGQKYILAYILTKTVNEFKGINPKDVVLYIEGEPLIGVVPVDPGMTNTVKEGGQRIVGFNSENSEINEGMIRFDIVFYVRMKDGLSQIIVNIEIQKDEPTKYNILDRAIFYVSRLVSSQKQRDFINTNYNDIKRSFSIWICLNMDENSMNYVHLTNDEILGSNQWKGRLDLLNIILIGLSNELPEQEEKYELHRLLGTLLSKELSAKEKLSIMEMEYDIPLGDNIRRDISVMCNLSQGIKEYGIKIGREDGIAEGEARIVFTMYEKGLTVEQIADITNKGKIEIEDIIKNKGAAFAQ